MASKKAKDGVTNVKEYFNKKKEGNPEEERKEEPLRLEEEDNRNINHNQEPESIVSLPSDNKKPEKTNFFSRGFNSMVNSTKSVKISKNLRQNIKNRQSPN